MLIGNIRTSARVDKLDPPTSNGSVLELARQLANTYSDREFPATTCGPITINGQSLGPMELAVRRGDQVYTGGAAPYVPTTVNFNGSTRLGLNSSLTASADSKKFTLSFWIKLRGVPSAVERIFTGYQTEYRFRLSRSGGDRIVFLGRNPGGGTTILEFTSGTTLTTDVWHHVLMSFDMASSSNRSIYIDDVLDSTTWITYTNDNLDFTNSEWYLGAGFDSTQWLNADMADFYFLPDVYVDFSNSTNRRKFIDVNLRPVDLGATGTTPGFGSPIVYFAAGSASNWNQNDGTAQDFSVVGTLSTGSTLVESVSLADYFSNTADNFSSWIIVNGNLTVDTGSIFIPPFRRLFTCIYITGNCTINGQLSMTARGANHSATGANITAAAIRIANGTYSSVVDPNVPATGGAGGLRRVASGASIQANVGLVGTAGSAGGCGGGGSGGAKTGAGGTQAGWANSGPGGAATSFSGGTGGGGASTSNDGQVVGAAGLASGGAGGAASPVSGASDVSAAGGAGNPGGSGDSNQAGSFTASGTGTGGVLMVIVEGILSGTGNVTANGMPGGNSGGTGNNAAGGGSGGGSITIMSTTDTSTFSVFAAAGGVGGTATVAPIANGGVGGAGTARKLDLTPGGAGFTNDKSITVADTAESYSRTQGTGTSRRIMTFSYWIYVPSVVATNEDIQISGIDSGDAVACVESGGNIQPWCADTSVSDWSIVSTGNLTKGAWNHVTVQFDTTQATATNRVKIFIGSTDVTWTSSDYPAQNQDLDWGASGTTERIVSRWTGTAGYRVDEIAKIDGQALPYSSFESGGLPTDLSGLTFGSQGYWIRFSSGVAATGGSDSSGNALTFTNTAYDNGDFTSLVPPTAAVETDQVYAEPASPTWQDSVGWSGYTIRTVFGTAGLTVPPYYQTQVRVLLRAGSVEGITFDGVYIGHRAAAGDDYDFAATPTRFLFSGGTTASIGVGNTLWSDWLNFTWDKTTALIISMHCSGSTSNDVMKREDAGLTCNGYWKAAVSEAATVNVTGYTISATNPTCYGVDTIEMNGF